MLTLGDKERKMSQWTHVNASIRFDAIFGQGLPTEKDLGKVRGLEDDHETILPCGSEGSIDYKIIRSQEESSLAAMVVVFFGDLRDYNNADEILSYFNKITKNKMIRSGILEIDVERVGIQVYRYNSDIEEFVICTL
jgi:hypothetical protein